VEEDARRLGCRDWKTAVQDRDGRGGKGLPRPAVSNKKAIFKIKRLLPRHSRRKTETRQVVAMEIRSQTRYLRLILYQRPFLEQKSMNILAFGFCLSVLAVAFP
jgi:hypothetical protein